MEADADGRRAGTFARAGPSGLAAATVTGPPPDRSAAVLAPSRAASGRRRGDPRRQGEVVWFRPTRPDTAMNFRTARLQGRAGARRGGTGRPRAASAVGHHVIVDSSYREIALLPGGRGPRSPTCTSSDHAARRRARHEPRAGTSTCRLGGPSQRQGRSAASSRRSRSRARASCSSGAASTTSRSRSRTTRCAGTPYDYFHVNSVDVDARRRSARSRRATRGPSTSSHGEHRRGRSAPRRQAQRLRRWATGRAFAWQHVAATTPCGGRSASSTQRARRRSRRSRARS